MEILDTSVQCKVVIALEERMWLDRRERPVSLPAVDSSALARVRAKARDFIVRMQLGPAGPYDAAGVRNPEAPF